MINKKLIHFNTYSAFEDSRSLLYDWSIAFIAETKQIYTHGNFYDCDIEDINELNDKIDEILSDIYIEIEYDVPNGIYVLTATGELIAYDDTAVDSTCLGVALITDNQRIVIEKTQSYDATNTVFYWGTNLYGKNVAGITETTDQTVAKADFSGKEHTNAIIAAHTEHSVAMHAQDMCSVLQTFNDGENNGGFTDWYIPAAGQLYEIYTNKTNINAALTAISSTAFSNSYYWSSSEYNSDKGWRVSLYNGDVNEYYKSSGSYSVRFVRDLPLKISLKDKLIELEQSIPTKVSELENDVPYVVDDVAQDGVYAVTSDGKLIDYNTADSSCIGVALIQGEHQFMIEKNGEANTTSIQAAYTADRASNTDYKYFYWGMYGSNNTSITNYTQTGGGGTSDYGFLPKADGSYAGSSNNLSGDYTTWTSGVLSDFNGKANTAALLAASDTDSYTTYANMATWCRIFNQTATENQGYTDWYIPACGQLALMYLNMTAINNALTKIGGQTIAFNNYWSSSECSSNIGWRVRFNDGYVYIDGKNSYYQVRFIRDIAIPSVKDRISVLESTKQDKIQIVDHGTSNSTFELTPNVLHRWDEMASLTLTLAAPTDATAVNHYMVEFVSGATATTLTMPDSIVWQSDLAIEAGKTYQISIVDNLGVIGGW